MENTPYNIHTGDIKNALYAFLRLNSFTKIAVLVDENTAVHCYTRIKDFLPEHTLIQIKSGEENKTLETCAQIWSTLTHEKFDRKSLLINLGGGVIGDMGGFCASTYKRGIAFVQVPTTLLSQVDASVGGKLGIDFNSFKNQIGLFCNPQAVFIDVYFLQTLDERLFNSGLAEVIKHALIKDKIHFEYLQKNRGRLNIEAVVDRSVEIKKSIVNEDFEETGLRKILNFGHTIGHAIESHLMENGTGIYHGEAVAAGMICECHLSHELGLLSEKEFQSVESFISSVFDPVPLNEADLPAIMNLMKQDKKNSNEKINFTLLHGIGTALFDQYIEEDKIHTSLKYYIS